MPLRPKSKSGQLADLLRARLTTGEWPGSVPAERVIAEEYLVSRTTVRHALAHLEADGLIGRSTSTRSGRAIVPKRSRADTATGRVVVLTPSLRDSPLVLEQLAILRDLLGRSGVQVTVREAARLAGLKKPDASLARLAASHPNAVWILHKMPRPVQAAATRLRLPALIFGSAFGDVDLPSIDVDFRAVARHAAGRCLARGHRRLTVIVHSRPAPYCCPACFPAKPWGSDANRSA